MMQEGRAMLPGAPKIYAAIAGVINDIGVVSKDKVNKQQGFKYRSVDDVYSVLNPALAKNKVFILPELLEENREIKVTAKGTQMICTILKMKYTIYAEDGSHIETVLKGEAMDTGDKAINKAMAIAYKYLCFQLFCIPVEDMTDPDGESPELGADKKDGKTSDRGRASGNNRRKTSGGKVTAQDSGAESPADAELKGQMEGYISEKGREALQDGGGKITEAMINTVRSEQKRTGVTDRVILARLHSKAKTIEDMTVEEFNQVMKIFQVTKDLKQEADDGHK